MLPRGITVAPCQVDARDARLAFEEPYGVIDTANIIIVCHVGIFTGFRSKAKIAMRERAQSFEPAWALMSVRPFLYSKHTQIQRPDGGRRPRFYFLSTPTTMSKRAQVSDNESDSGSDVVSAYPSFIPYLSLTNAF